MLFFLFLLTVGTQNSTSSCEPFRGGFADGMCPGRLISKQGPFEVVKLLPARAAGAAIPSKIASTLSKLLKSQRTGNPIDRELIVEGAQARFCLTDYTKCRPPEPLRSWHLGKEFNPNRPYLLADGTVRIEWLRKGELEQISLITLDGAKVKDIATISASVPRSVQWSRYQGGPLDGLGVGLVTRPDNGARIINLMPSIANASPIPAEDVPAVQAFVDAFQRRDRSKLEGFLTNDAAVQSCMQRNTDECEKPVEFDRVQVGTECTFNTPYYLGNQVIRLEWLLNGVLWYWTELHMAEGKIRLVRVHRPDVPDEVRSIP